MNESLDAPYVSVSGRFTNFGTYPRSQVKGSHLVNSAYTVRRRITPDMIAFFEEWRDLSGVRSA